MAERRLGIDAQIRRKACAVNTKRMNAEEREGRQAGGQMGMRSWSSRLSTHSAQPSQQSAIITSLSMISNHIGKSAPRTAHEAHTHQPAILTACRQQPFAFLGQHLRLVSIDQRQRHRRSLASTASHEPPANHHPSLASHQVTPPSTSLSPLSSAYRDRCNAYPGRAPCDTEISTRELRTSILASSHEG